MSVFLTLLQHLFYSFLSPVHRTLHSLSICMPRNLTWKTKQEPINKKSQFLSLTTVSINLLLSVHGSNILTASWNTQDLIVMYIFHFENVYSTFFTKKSYSILKFSYSVHSWPSCSKKTIKVTVTSFALNISF